MSSAPVRAFVAGITLPNIAGAVLAVIVAFGIASIWVWIGWDLHYLLVLVLGAWVIWLHLKVDGLQNQTSTGRHHSKKETPR